MDSHLIRMDGHITAAGFASGDRFVIGNWRAGPFGPMRDIMWARPDGEKVLLASSAAAARYVTAVYTCDRVEVTPIAVHQGRRSVTVRAGPFRMEAALRRWRLPVFVPQRPLWFTRMVEEPVCRMVFPGVHPYGTHPNGIRQWYPATWVQLIATARGAIQDRDLGSMTRVEPAVGFGFSEPPRRPAVVRVRPALLDPTGRLQRVLDRP